jgi:hypothetical protein
MARSVNCAFEDVVIVLSCRFREFEGQPYLFGIRVVLDFFRFFWSAARSTAGTRDVTSFACSLSQEAAASQNSAQSKNGVLEDRSLDASSTHPPKKVHRSA